MGEAFSQNNKKSLFKKFFFVFCLLLLAVLIFGAGREYLKRKEIDREIAELEKELAGFNVKNKGFLDSLKLYESGFFIEQEARTKLNYKKPGEKVVVIPGAEKSLKAGEGAEKTEAAAAVAGAWKNAGEWWEYFFKD